jgi:hypothetical protein
MMATIAIMAYRADLLHPILLGAGLPNVLFQPAMYACFSMETDHTLK